METLMAVEDIRFKNRVTSKYKIVSRKSLTFGEFPTVSEVQKAMDDIGGFNWVLKGSDARLADKAGLDTDCEWTDAEELISDMKKLLDAGGEDIVSSVMDVLGFEWV